jgi:cytosine/adenosine deaminase-related metal-dependent hydrolase
MPDGVAGTLIRGGYVLTSSDRGTLVDSAIRVVGDQIVEVGPWAELSEQFDDDVVAGGPNDIVTAGFVNTHGHFSEALVTGIAKQHTLWEWIASIIGPVAPHLDREMAYVGTLLAGIQMLKSGITTTNDMFVSDPRSGEHTTPGVVDALDELGLRGVVSFGAGDIRGASIEGILDEHEALSDACRQSDLCEFRVGIAAIGAQSDDLLSESVKLAHATGGTHIHLQEVREEVTATRQRFGVTPVAHCADIGLFDAPAVAAHCVWVDDDDISILADHQVGVAHNPVSNMILASGVCPVRDLRNSGVAVGIGVDGPASNDRQDMMEAIKMTSLLQKVDQLQATAFTAEEALDMATAVGAGSLGLESRVGSLEPGKAADIVILDGESASLANVHDPVAALVYAAGPSEIKEVWVNGSKVVEGGDVTTVDEADVVARSRPLSEKLVALSGIAS